MKNTVVSVKPEFGVNYKVGDIGFTFTDGSIISCGIAWFTRWDRGENSDVPNIPVSHVFVVSGDDECIEAIPPKVTRSSLDSYFYCEHTHVVFRRPVGLTEELGERIAGVAATRIGCSYGYPLLVGHLMANCFLGRFASWATGGWSSRTLETIFDNKQQYICSELASTSLNMQFEYNSKGILAQPAHTISPQPLFEDRVIFQPWATKVKGEKVKVQRPSR